MITTFKISAAEFNDAIIEKIKMMFTGDDNEVVISVRSKKKEFPKETRDDYFSRINRALDALDNKQGTVSFSAEEFEKLN
jgi:DNA relaxase NicK